MEFVTDDMKSELVILFLLITGNSMVHALHPSGVTSSDIETTQADGVNGKCQLKDMVTVFTQIDGSGCISSRNSADNLYHYLVIVQNRCKYCNAKGVGVEVSGYLLGNEIVNLTQPFAPGGDQFVLKYSNSNQVGGVSPSHATFYECRDL
jgi:hypothetical protein